MNQEIDWAEFRAAEMNGLLRQSGLIGNFTAAEVRHAEQLYRALSGQDADERRAGIAAEPTDEQERSARRDPREGANVAAEESQRVLEADSTGAGEN